jgi:hypothetical protein
MRAAVHTPPWVELLPTQEESFSLQITFADSLRSRNEAIIAFLATGVARAIYIEYERCADLQTLAHQIPFRVPCSCLEISSLVDSVAILGSTWTSVVT